MTGSEWLIIAFALLFLFFGGAWHLAGLRLVSRLKPQTDSHPHLGVLLAFWGITLLHLSEIVLGALAYAVVMAFPGTGAIEGGFGDSPAGFLYFSGITYATLGFTQQTLTGPVRLLAMLQSLGGFMLITWSATFVYTLWGEVFRRPAQDDSATAGG